MMSILQLKVLNMDMNFYIVIYCKYWSNYAILTKWQQEVKGSVSSSSYMNGRKIETSHELGYFRLLIIFATHADLSLELKSIFLQIIRRVAIDFIQTTASFSSVPFMRRQIPVFDSESITRCILSSSGSRMESSKNARGRRERRSHSFPICMFSIACFTGVWISNLKTKEYR